MKKMMFGLACSAAIVACADVESSNVVGYKTYDCAAGIDNVGTVFAPINETAEWTFSANVYDTAAKEGDIVMFLNTDLFDLDYYQFNGYNGSASLGWTYNTSDPNTGDPISETVASFKIGKGQVTYCQPGDGVSGFMTAGQVENIKAPAVVEFKDVGFYEFVNPYPKATTLGDLETFCQEGDVLMVLNFNIFDLDFYQFNGKNGDASLGWTYNTSDPNTGDPVSETITDSTLVVLPAGQGGYFQPGDGGNRTWTVGL